MALPEMTSRRAVWWFAPRPRMEQNRDSFPADAYHQERCHVGDRHVGDQAESLAIRYGPIERAARERGCAEAAHPRRRAEARLHFRREGSDQSRFEQLFRTDHAQGIAK